ncbi:hypothetical protein ABT084_18320 [Streptomyces sp. NPDC002138]|uniref:hypothetical protein n=1 Tax=Streptomyces sp. NPDC002138 TaxID=3154410 RepID=UPI003330521E
MMIPVRLLDSVPLPGGEGLTSGFALESRSEGRRRALLRSGDVLEVYDLDALWAGERAPVAAFPVPWPAWTSGEHSVSPDGSFAVFSGQRSVRAVGADGVTLWVYGHGCWDQEVGHAHSGDEQQICRDFESGSCRVSDDGRLVWAHVVAEGEYEECWVVLDARDGAELARVPLDSVTSGSNHLSHPDGVHMGLGIGMGQDGILLHWARWDGHTVTSWDLNETMDRILADVHPEHAGYLTLEHYGYDITLHALDGTVLATGQPAADGADGADADADADEAEGEAEDLPAWDYSCGFVDGDTVIATTTEYDEAPELARHWLLDAHTLRVRGQVAYPQPVDSLARPLGDGTWLTYDAKTADLHRWGITGDVTGAS